MAESVQVLQGLRAAGPVKRVEVKTHPGGRFTGKKHYRGIDRRGTVMFEIAAPGDDAGRRAARAWIREHGLKVGKYIYTSG